MDFAVCFGLAVLGAYVSDKVRAQGGAQNAPNTDGFNVQSAWIFFIAQYAIFKYYRIFLYPVYFSPLRHLPGPSDGHFLFGQGLKLLKAKTPTALYIKWMRENPDAPFIRYLSFFNTEVLVANSLTVHKEILHNQCYSLSKSQWFLRIVKEVAGHGLILMEGDEHKAHRRMLNAPFSLKNIRKLEPVFKATSRDICRFLNRNIAENGRRTTTFDCTDIFMKGVLDIMGSAILGVDLKYLKSENGDHDSSHVARPLPKPQNTSLDGKCSFVEAYDVFFSPGPMGKVLLLANGYVPTRWLPLRANREFLFAMDWLNDVLKTLIRTRYSDVLATMSAGNYESDDTRDVLTWIVEESVPGGSAEGIREEEFLGHLLEFMAAGHDTSTNMLSWACYILATKHATQERLREEVSLLPTEPSYAELDKLPYLDNFVKEAMRLYPPATTYHREANCDLNIEGIHIRKGTPIDLCPSVTLLNPVIWGANVDVVDPTRWDRLEGHQQSPYAFNAFSNGPRICIGRAFAIFEIKIILVEVVRNFRLIDVVKPFKVENPGFTLRPNGLEIRVERVDG
ncbi:cytochrome P450 [Xylariaceae sp. FL0016]|nr:cytochrome P450 [Xylariaceae sp. FL0016]